MNRRSFLQAMAAALAAPMLPVYAKLDAVLPWKAGLVDELIAGAETIIDRIDVGSFHHNRAGAWGGWWATPEAGIVIPRDSTLRILWEGRRIRLERDQTQLLAVGVPSLGEPGSTVVSEAHILCRRNGYTYNIHAEQGKPLVILPQYARAPSFDGIKLSW